jgi:hypothetical protein
MVRTLLDVELLDDQQPGDAAVDRDEPEVVHRTAVVSTTAVPPGFLAEAGRVSVRLPVASWIRTSETSVSVETVAPLGKASVRLPVSVNRLMPDLAVTVPVAAATMLTLLAFGSVEGRDGSATVVTPVSARVTELGSAAYSASVRTAVCPALNGLDGFPAWGSPTEENPDTMVTCLPTVMPFQEGNSAL